MAWNSSRRSPPTVRDKDVFKAMLAVFGGGARGASHRHRLPLIELSSTDGTADTEKGPLGGTRAAAHLVHRVWVAVLLWEVDRQAELPGVDDAVVACRSQGVTSEGTKRHRMSNASLSPRCLTCSPGTKGHRALLQHAPLVSLYLSKRLPTLACPTTRARGQPFSACSAKSSG